MLKRNEVKMLDELFLSSFFSYNNLKKIKIKNVNSNVKKLYSESLDVLYDAMDTVLEILDMCGANK